MKQKIFYYILIFFILASVIFILFYRNQLVELFKKDKIQKNEFQSTSIISNDKTPAESDIANSKPSKETTLWLTYKSEEGKIELSYPAEWPIISDQPSAILEEKKDFPFLLILGNDKERILTSKLEDQTRVLVSMTNLLSFDFGHHTVGSKIGDSEIIIDNFPADKTKFLSVDGNLMEIDVIVNVKDRRYLFEISAENGLEHKERLFNEMLEKVNFLEIIALPGGYQITHPTEWISTTISTNDPQIIKFYLNQNSQPEDLGEFIIYIYNNPEKLSLQNFFDGKKAPNLFKDAIGGYKPFALLNYDGYWLDDILGFTKDTGIAVSIGDKIYEFLDPQQKHQQDGIFLKVISSFEKK